MKASEPSVERTRWLSAARSIAISDRNWWRVAAIVAASQMSPMIDWKRGFCATGSRELIMHEHGRRHESRSVAAPPLFDNYPIGDVPYTLTARSVQRA